MTENRYDAKKLDITMNAGGIRREHEYAQAYADIPMKAKYRNGFHYKMSVGNNSGGHSGVAKKKIPSKQVHVPHPRVLVVDAGTGKSHFEDYVENVA